MAIILASTGLPLLTSKGVIASRAAAAGTGGGTPPIPDPKPIPLNYASDGLIAYGGVDFRFSTPVYWLASANGDPVVISHPDYLPSGSSITAMSPASTNASGQWGNGAMLNPCANDSTEAMGGNEFQGMDELSANSSPAGKYPYQHSLNVDPGATGAAIRVNPGDSFTVVKSVRISNPPTLRNIHHYVTLTVMGSLPPRSGTWIRPSVSQTGGNMAWTYRMEDANLGVLRSLPQPPQIFTVAGTLAEITERQLQTLPMWWHSGEGGRRMAPATDYGDYSGTYGGPRGKWMCALHTPASDASKRLLAGYLCTYAVDVIGAYRERGIDRSAGAGQHFGFIQFPFLLAFLFGDQSVLDDTYKILSNDINQIGYVTEAIVNQTRNWDPGTEGQSRGRVDEAYLDANDIGLPEWTQSAFNPGETEMEESFINLERAYREQWPMVAPYTLLAIGLMLNGPGGQTGEEAIRGGAGTPTGPANIRAAAFDYLDRLITWDPLNGGAPGHDEKALYAAWRDLIDRPRWTGRPDICTGPVVSNVEFAAGSGNGEIAVAFATSSTYSTLPLTGREVEVSLDNVQFVKRQPVSAKSTISGLRQNTEHFVRARHGNAAGWSRWSQTWPYHIGDNATLPEFRGFVRTKGSGTGAPVNTAQPLVHYRPRPGWDTTPPYSAAKTTTVPHVPQTTYGFAPVTDVNLMRDIRFYAGAGYWSGSGDLTFTYQWQRNDGSGGAWANIAGATRQFYDRSAADAGHSIRCRVTATDANGSASEFTNAAAIPPAEQFPSGVLLSTTFDPGFLGTWPTLWANTSGSNGNLLFQPYYYWTEDESLGGIAVDKTSSHPTIFMPLGNVPADVDLFYEIHYPIGMHDGMAAQAGRSSEIRLKTGDGATAWETVKIPHDSHQGRVFVARGSIRIPASAADKSVRLEVYGSSNNGGGGGGNPALSEAHLWLATAAPNQFRPDMWSLSGKTVTLKATPRANGAAISGVEYQVNGGGWTRAGVASGSFAVAAAIGDRVSIRAVSANGGGPASHPKEIA